MMHTTRRRSGRKEKYLPLSESNVSPKLVSSYDGQEICLLKSSLHRQHQEEEQYHQKRDVRFYMGNYLGGGIAGVVYEAFDKAEQRHVAIKILNPVGYKLVSPATLRRCQIIKKGVPLTRCNNNNSNNNSNSSSSSSNSNLNITLENVYWVQVPNRRELIGCYVDGRSHSSNMTMVHGASSGISSGVSLFLRELTLEMCVAIWNLDALEQLEEEEQQQRDRFVHGGTIIKEDDPIESFSLLEDEVNGATTTTIRSSSTTTTSTTSTSTSTTTFTTESKRRTSIHRSIGEQVQIGDQLYEIPLIPEKFKRFLINRKSIYREIAHMHRLTGTTIDGSFYSSNGNGTSGHENVLKLFDVLEFIQASKSTIFLVLELAHGGELFDRIKALKPTELGQQASSQENLARKYFTQLVSGVLYCHELGIVHRDLKPENLLLSEKDVLKIADFGLSAHFIAAVSHTTSTPSPCLGPLNVEELNNNQRELEELRLTPSQQQTKEKELPSKSTSTSTSMSSCNFSSSSLPVTRCFRRLNSVVGTPHYVAPEVLQTSAYGYDGRKADMWSMGVILYGLLMGSLPFGKELSQCPRYFKFSEWIRTLPSDSQTSKLIYEPSFYQETIHTAKNPHTNENDVHDFNQSIEEDFLSNQQNHPHLFPSSQQQPLRQYTKMSRRSTCSSVVMNFPSWFFPSRISSSAVFLLANLLHPDPARRFSCEEVCKASWIMEDSQQQQEEEQQQQQQQQQENQLPYHHQVNDLFLSF